MYQSKEFSQAQVKDNYESHLCESTDGSTSLQETLLNPSKWIEVEKKNEFSKCKFEKEKVNVNVSMPNKYVSMPQTDEVDLIHRIKFKV